MVSTWWWPRDGLRVRSYRVDASVERVLPEVRVRRHGVARTDGVPDPLERTLHDRLLDEQLTEVVRADGPRRGVEDAGIATLARVAWFSEAP